MLLWVKKLTSVVYVDELLMTSCQDFSKKESIFLEQQLKHLLYCKFPLGAPFTLHIGCKVYLPSWNNLNMSFIAKDFYIIKDVTENSALEDNNLIKDMQNMTITSKNNCDSIAGGSVSIPSQLMTLDECYGSDISVANVLSKKKSSSCDIRNLTDETHMRESMNLSSISGNIFTSTPRKSNCSEENIDTLFSISKNHNRDISAIKKHSSQVDKGEVFQKYSMWFRVGRNTKITLQHVETTKAKDTSEVTQAKEKYCKDFSAYCSLMKIVQTKLKDFKFRGKYLFLCRIFMAFLIA